MEEKLEKQENNKPERDAKGRLLPGNTANPKGRPKGKTIKERVREWLEDHPDDMRAFVEHFVKKNRELAWQMLEGGPKQSGDFEVKLPKPIDDVFQDDSIQENKSIEEEDKGNSGGDSGQ